MATFSHESNLPSLPVPDIDETLEKYYKSQKAILSEKDFESFKLCYDDFMKNEKDAAFERFRQKYVVGLKKEPNNWLQNLWLDYAYLCSREPLYHVNTAGLLTKTPGEDICIKSLAYMLYGYAKMWNEVKTEVYKPQIFRGTPWSMKMFRDYFSSSQIAGLEKDELQLNFKTDNEGEPDFDTEKAVLQGVKN